MHMSVRVVAIAGMPGSGKGEVAAVLAARGIPILSMGDMVREEVRRRGLAEAPHVFGEVVAICVHPTARRSWRFDCVMQWIRLSRRLHS